MTLSSLSQPKVVTISSDDSEKELKELDAALKTHVKVTDLPKDIRHQTRVQILVILLEIKPI